MKNMSPKMTNPSTTHLKIWEIALPSPLRIDAPRLAISRHGLFVLLVDSLCISRWFHVGLCILSCAAALHANRCSK